MTGRHLAIVAVLVIALALAGVWLGRMVQPAAHHSGAELHALMHDELELDDAQERSLAVLERDFAGRRDALEAQLRADNARLAEAIAVRASAVAELILAMAWLLKCTICLMPVKLVLRFTKTNFR